MDENIKLEIPDILYKQLWTRYLPQTTLQVYGVIYYLTKNEIFGQKAIDIITNYKIKKEKINSRIIDEKKKALKTINFEYPTNKQKDLELLKDLNLIKMGKVKGKKAVIINNQLKSPEETLDLPEGEIEILKNIKFEMRNQEEINKVLNTLLDKDLDKINLSKLSKKLDVTIEKLKSVIEFLTKEGSVKINVDKIENIDKDKEIELSIDEKILKEKRQIID